MFEFAVQAGNGEQARGGCGPVTGDATGVVGPVALERLCADAAGLDGLRWDQLDHATLLGLIGRLQVVSRAVEAAVAVGMASADRASATERATGLSAANWWARARLGSGGQGAWLVRAGDLIGCFEHLGRTVARGELTLEHLRAIDEVGDRAVVRELVALDEELCREASAVTLAQWRRCLKVRVSHIREELARRAAALRDAQPADEEPSAAGQPDAEPSDAEPPPTGSGGPGVPDDHDAEPADTDGRAELFEQPGHGLDEQVGRDDGWLSLRPTADGGLLLRGQLFGSTAELLRQVLDTATSHQRRAAWREHDATGIAMPGAGQLRARALVDLIRRGAATDLRRSTPARTEAVVVIRADDRAAERIRALDGEPLTPEAAALLTCDAHLRALVVDRAGHPLWLGRSTRLASPAQRRALAVRDGGCVFPGCDMPAEWCDAHHQPGWEHGGTTDVDAMVLLCRRHHGAAHSRRWLLTPVDAGIPTPGGRPRSGAPPGRPTADGHHDRARPGTERRTPPARRADQRFEWHDNLTGRIMPAQQRGLEDPQPGRPDRRPGPGDRRPGPGARQPRRGDVAA